MALKEIQERHADDPDSRARFLLEAEITGRLEHPGIVPVYGLGHVRRRPALSTPCGSSGASSLKEAIDRFHARTSRRATRASGRWRSASCSGGSSTSATRSPTPTAGGCSTATSSRQHHARPVRRDPGRRLGPGQGRRAGPSRASPRCRRGRSGPSRRGGGATLPGARLGTPAYMSPEQAAGRLDQLGPGQRRLQPGRHALLPADRPAAVRGRRRRRRPCRRSSGATSRRRGRSTPDVPPAAGGGLPEGDGAASRDDRYPSPGRWPTTSSTGWPTSRSRPTASRGRPARPLGPPAPSRRSPRPRRSWSRPWPRSRSAPS